MQLLNDIVNEHIKALEHHRSMITDFGKKIKITLYIINYRQDYLNFVRLRNCTNCFNKYVNESKNHEKPQVNDVNNPHNNA